MRLAICLTAAVVLVLLAVVVTAIPSAAPLGLDQTTFAGLAVAVAAGAATVLVWYGLRS
jgi:hypothetical protein